MGGGAVVLGILLAVCASAHGAHAAGSGHASAQMGTVVVRPSTHAVGPRRSISVVPLRSTSHSLPVSLDTNASRARHSPPAGESAWTVVGRRHPELSAATWPPASTLPTRPHPMAVRHSRGSVRAPVWSDISAFEPTFSNVGDPLMAWLPSAAVENLPFPASPTVGSLMLACDISTVAVGFEYQLALPAMVVLLLADGQMCTALSGCVRSSLLLSVPCPPG
jgi:hypothetical protein